MLNKNTKENHESASVIEKTKQYNLPIIHQIEDNEEALKKLQDDLKSRQKVTEKELLFDYPVRIPVSSLWKE